MSSGQAADGKGQEGIVTHTYATLEVSAAAYEEIKSKLLAAEYQHAINDEGEIDMHGIALVREKDE